MAVFKKEHHRMVDILGRRARLLQPVISFVADIDDSFEKKEELLDYIEDVYFELDGELTEVSRKLIKLMIRANLRILENKERADELEAEIAEMRKTEEKFNRLPAYVTPKIVAEHFNVSRYKVAKMQKKGILPEPRKHGRNRYWHKSVIRGLEL